MCSGNGAPGISTTLSGKRGMSDKRALLWLFARILSHLGPSSLDTPRQRPLPPVGVWGKLVGEKIGLGVEDGIHGGENVRHCRQQGMTEGGIHAGHVALVTGAGRGIGAATARLLAREGAAVARTEEEIASVAHEISSRGSTALPVSLDVADENSVSACFERVRGELGNVTILINNAGTPGVPLPVAVMPPEGWRRAFDVNVTGAFLCAREALPGMVSANWGRIVNVSSAAARHPVAGMA